VASVSLGPFVLRCDEHGSNRVHGLGRMALVAEDAKMILWVGMFAAGAISVFAGYRWGYRNGRKRGFEAGKLHGRFWADWAEEAREL